jgi:hypothetical protein
MEDAAFHTETEPKARGFPDFFIDSAVSSILFIAEYKDALRAWKEQHGGTTTAKPDRQAAAPGRADERRQRTLASASV